jgi:hypothetical protein
MGREPGNYPNFHGGRFAILKTVVRNELEAVTPDVVVRWTIAEGVGLTGQFARLRAANDPILQGVLVGIGGR